MIADGINHSIPSPREIKDLTKWLLKNDMIAIHLKKYSLTKKGHIIYGFAHLSADNILNTWKNLELQMKKIS